MRDYMRNRRGSAKSYIETWESSNPGFKMCRKCGEGRPVLDFPPRKAGKDGLNSQCRFCVAERKRVRRAADPSARDKERAYERQPHVAARTTARNASREYGISIDEFEQMKNRQAGCCAVCGRERKLAVDHCHGSGRVRELLCYPCNIALGQVNDDVDLLQELIRYVERHRV
jgi:hypothetical protein